MNKAPIYINVIRARPPAFGRCPCGQRIEWVTTERGRRMPIDHPLLAEAVFERPGLEPITQINAGQSHFVTCPNADQYRRRKGGA